MSFPHSHKTIFVLDKGPFFSNSSKQLIEFDVFTKSRGPGFIPLAPVAKSLWTCNVEAVIEYCRIVYDIYPTKRNICMFLSDNTSKALNGWNPKEQTLQHMMVAFAGSGLPNSDLKREDCLVTYGLCGAVEALCHPTPDQEAFLSAGHNTEGFMNRGRIICLTHCRNEAAAKTIEDSLAEAINDHNKLAAEADDLIPVDHVEFNLVHVTPVGLEGPIRARPKRQVTPFLSSDVHTSQSGRHISLKMVQLVMNHLDLLSTTITGIPMKEEQNASSSANYDVELLHSSAAHTDLISSGHADGLTIPSKEGLYSKTVTLKWLTPKTNVVELQACTGCYRITSVDVNSRPSSCLTNFLLNGRSVMLEQPRKSGNKVVSHMLTSHGGEIYIHVLASGRSPLEDPPSISEGCGGRVTDYRITNFGDLMKENRLAPAGNIAASMEELPIDRAKKQLDRVTRHWPITISETIIFNMTSQLDPLPNLIIKERLTEDEVLECKKVIYRIVEMESRNENLMVPVIGTRGKGPKREEQYRQMWSEFETFVASHANNSRGHQQVLECLQECKRPEERGSPKKSVDKLVVKEEAEAGWKDYDRYQKMTEKEKQDLNKVDRPSSQPFKKVKTEPGFGLSTHGGQSLLAIWTSRMNALHSTRHEEFAGRKNASSNKAELYTHLNEDSNKNGIKTEIQAGVKR